MGRCRVVRPTVVRLPMSDGDFVDVKQALSAGEYVDLLTDMAGRVKFAKLVQYLVGWSLVGLDDQPIPYTPDLPAEERRALLGALDTRTLRELVAVVDRHEAAQEAALTEKKTIPPAAVASSPISPSPAAATGATNGSGT